MTKEYDVWCAFEEDCPWPLNKSEFIQMIAKRKGYSCLTSTEAEEALKVDGITIERVKIIREGK